MTEEQKKELVSDINEMIQESNNTYEISRLAWLKDRIRFGYYD